MENEKLTRAEIRRLMEQHMNIRFVDLPSGLTQPQALDAYLRAVKCNDDQKIRILEHVRDLYGIYPTIELMDIAELVVNAQLDGTEVNMGFDGKITFDMRKVEDSRIRVQIHKDGVIVSTAYF